MTGMVKAFCYKPMLLTGSLVSLPTSPVHRVCSACAPQHNMRTSLSWNLTRSLPHLRARPGSQARNDITCAMMDRAVCCTHNIGFVHWRWGGLAGNR